MHLRDTAAQRAATPWQWAVRRESCGDGKEGQIIGEGTLFRHRLPIRTMACCSRHAAARTCTLHVGSQSIASYYKLRVTRLFCVTSPIGRLFSADLRSAFSCQCWTTVRVGNLISQGRGDGDGRTKTDQKFLVDPPPTPTVSFGVVAPSGTPYVSC